MIRDWYAAYLRAVEYDRAKWGDDPLIYGDPILRKARWSSFDPKGVGNTGQLGIMEGSQMMSSFV